MSRSARAPRPLPSAPPWASRSLVAIAALIAADVVFVFLTRLSGAIPESPEWRRTMWSGMAAQLTAVVAAVLLALVGLAQAPQRAPWVRYLAVAVLTVFGLSFAIGGVGVVLDGRRVLATLGADRETAVLWVSIWTDAMRGLAGAAVCGFGARWLLRPAGEAGPR